VMTRDMPQVVEQVLKMIAARRDQPTADLTSVLVHAEIDGECLEDQDIVMGFFLLLIAGFDSTKSVYSSGMRALMDHPEERQRLLDDPSLIPSAVEETLRMFPPATHFRRTATCDTELGGKQIRQGDKVAMWYVSSNRDEARFKDPNRFDVGRNPDHDTFGARGRHYCLGNALGRLELRIMFEETLARFPNMQPLGEPDWAKTMWLNQLRSLPVLLTP
jgi:cytochrome P450